MQKVWMLVPPLEGHEMKHKLAHSGALLSYQLSYPCVLYPVHSFTNEYTAVILAIHLALPITFC